MASVGHILVIYFLQGFVLGEPQHNALNVASVLLPYVPRGSVHTNFTLRALQGCYLWYVLGAREAKSVPAILHIFLQCRVSQGGFNFLFIFPRVSHRPEVASIQPLYSSEEEESGENFLVLVFLWQESLKITLFLDF